MAYSIDPIQDNCYPGTTVLVNKLHIHDDPAPYESGGSKVLCRIRCSLQKEAAPYRFYAESLNCCGF